MLLFPKLRPSFIYTLLSAALPPAVDPLHPTYRSARRNKPRSRGGAMMVMMILYSNGDLGGQHGGEGAD